MSQLITTPFNAQSTATDVIAGVDLSTKRAIVTGAASGIGVETARVLAEAGAEVTIAVRNVEAGERVAAEIGSAEQVHVAALDLADLDSVREFVAHWSGPLDILVNNAGVMACPLERTAPGWELQFATNHLGHFALALGLYGALRAAPNARVVSVSSSAHLRSGIVFDDIQFEQREYEPWSAYGQSKSANVLFAVEATRRWADDDITVNALMPGAIQTALQRHVSEAELAALRAQAGPAPPSWKSVEAGAATSVLLAASPLVAGVSGRYFEDCNEAKPHQEGTRTGVAAHALDPDAARELWEVSLELLAPA